MEERVNGGGTRRNVCTMAGTALAVRLFCRVTLDGPDLLNAGWLAVIAGGVMGGVALWPFLKEPKENSQGGKVLRHSMAGRAACLLLAVVMFYDAAVSMRLLAMLSEYVMMTDFKDVTLILPITLATLAACLMGTGAVCAAGSIWYRVGLAMAILLALAQIGEIEPAYLFPIGGPGFFEWSKGALDLGGLTGGMVLAGFVLSPGAKKEGKRQGVNALVRPVLIAAAASILFAMLVPAMPEGSKTRLFRLEALLDNGFSGLSMELAYVVILVGGLILTVMFEAQAASVCAARSLNIKKTSVCTTVICLLIGACALIGWADQSVAMSVERGIYLFAVPAAGLAASAVGREKKR